MPMRKHDECARACRRHAALPLPAVDFVAVRARAAVHSAAAVAPTSAAPVLRLAAAAVLLFPAARATLSRARVRLACVAAAPPLAAAPLTASYKGAAVGATALACSNGDSTPSGIPLAFRYHIGLNPTWLPPAKCRKSSLAPRSAERLPTSSPIWRLRRAAWARHP